MAEVRLALDDYRNGLVTAAIDRLDDDNRIIVADTWDDLLDQMAADWHLDHQRHQAGHTIPSQMIAERNTDRHALNRRAQAWLRHDGTLTHPTPIGDDTFHLGDRVVAQRPERALTSPDDPRAHVINGSVGTVTAIRGNKDRPDLVVDFDHLGTIRVPHDFIATEVGPGRGGGLTPAYAVTSYKAEGQTYDTARGLAAPGAINTEGMYVALTRGRNDLRVYSIAPADQRTEPPELPIIEDTRAATKALADTLDRWRGADIATVADPQCCPHPLAVRCLAADVGASGGLEVERARRAIEIRITGHAIANPEPALVAYLGPRPATGAHRTEWDEAVARHALYHHRWTPPGRIDRCRSRPLTGTEPALQQQDHVGDRRSDRQGRASATSPPDLSTSSEPCDRRPPTALDPPATGRASPQTGSHDAEAGFADSTTRSRAARAQHLALATRSPTAPDRIETARPPQRAQPSTWPNARQATPDCQPAPLESAATGDPAARTEVERCATDRHRHRPQDHQTPSETPPRTSPPPSVPDRLATTPAANAGTMLRRTSRPTGTRSSASPPPTGRAQEPASKPPSAGSRSTSPCSDAGSESCGPPRRPAPTSGRSGPRFAESLSGDWCSQVSPAAIASGRRLKLSQTTINTSRQPRLAGSRSTLRPGSSGKRSPEIAVLVH